MRGDCAVAISAILGCSECQTSESQQSVSPLPLLWRNLMRSASESKEQLTQHKRDITKGHRSLHPTTSCARHTCLLQQFCDPTIYALPQLACDHASQTQRVRYTQSCLYKWYSNRKIITATPQARKRSHDSLTPCPVSKISTMSSSTFPTRSMSSRLPRCIASQVSPTLPILSRISLSSVWCDWMCLTISTRKAIRARRSST
jgi:hypothetical protein